MFFISGIVRTVPPFSRPFLFSLASEILVKKGKEDDESIHSFFSRRLGKEVRFFLLQVRACFYQTSQTGIWHFSAESVLNLLLLSDLCVNISVIKILTLLDLYGSSRELPLEASDVTENHRCPPAFTAPPQKLTGVPHLSVALSYNVIYVM